MKRNLLKLLFFCTLAAAPAVSCVKDDPKDPETPAKPDPDTPDTPDPEPEKAAILEFTPTEGGAGTELSIKGTNFGDNADAIRS